MKHLLLFMLFSPSLVVGQRDTCLTIQPPWRFEVMHDHVDGGVWYREWWVEPKIKQDSKTLKIQ